MTLNLDNRSLIILKTIVEEFIKSGVPVGSRFVARKCGLALSPATVRNIMSDLEKASFLEQTHISSGRMPTDIGYRFYVDNFAVDFIAKAQELNSFKNMCSDSGGHLGNLIRKVTVLLSNYSHLVSVVLTPKIYDMIFHHISFIKLSKSKVLSVIVSKSGFVSNNVVTDKWDLSQEALDRMSNLLNDKLVGYRFSEYRKILLKMMVEEENAYSQLISKAMSLGTMALKPSIDSQVFVEGQMHVVSHPEFFDTEKMKNILTAFEEKSKLLNILDKCSHSKGVQIFIGVENNDMDMKDYSLVLSKYAVNKRAVGALGVIGPKRMEYSKVIPLVESAADALNKID